MIRAVSSAVPAFAVIVAVPSAYRPVTRPEPSTLAIAASPDVQCNDPCLIACPFASNARAVKRRVSPGAIVSAAGDTLTESAFCTTVTAAVPAAGPAFALMVAWPFPAAVTRPSRPTAATVVSPLSHSTPAPSMSWPLASVTVAASAAVSPRAEKTSESGASATAAGTCFTVTAASADAVPALAVTVARPFPAAVTTPSRPTAATAVSPLAHSTPASSISWPLASVTVAASAAVSPRAEKTSESGASATAAGTCFTVTAASADAVPALAVTVARPFPAAVTRPRASTVAIPAAPDAQVTAASGIGLPFWSLTVAVSCTVPPNAASSADEGDTVTVVGSGGGTGSSQAAKAMARTTAALGNRRGRNGVAHGRWRLRFSGATPEDGLGDGGRTLRGGGVETGDRQGPEAQPCSATGTVPTGISDLNSLSLVRRRWRGKPPFHRTCDVSVLQERIGIYGG